MRREQSRLFSFNADHKMKNRDGGGGSTGGSSSIRRAVDIAPSKTTENYIFSQLTKRSQKNFLCTYFLVKSSDKAHHNKAR